MDGTGLAPETYLPRVVDAKVDRYLRLFGAVEISGAKWCGKTWTALRHGGSVSYIDDEYDVAMADPSMVTMGEHPHVIDEWQLVPGIWDAVRREVDRRGVRGGWILTGSSTPRFRGEGSERLPKHSGAGRIGRIRMHPMSLAESGDSTSEISLAGLFRHEFHPCKVKSDTRELIGLTCRGGWPAAIGLPPADALAIAREYLEVFLREAIPVLGKSSDTAGRLLASLARNLGQAATYKTISSDMYGGEADGGPFVSTDTISSYLSLFRDSYLMEELRGWVPQTRSPKRLSIKPKRYLADPSLAVARLGMDPASLEADWQTFGLIFESMCVRDLLVYASAMTEIGFEPLRYYRDDTGLEVDAIVELSDGRWAAFEIKTSDDKVADADASLKRLRTKLCDRAGARVRPPEFMAVLVGASQYARELDEGIYSIPIRAFGP